MFRWSRFRKQNAKLSSLRVSLYWPGRCEFVALFCSAAQCYLFFLAWFSVIYFVSFWFSATFLNKWFDVIYQAHISFLSECLLEIFLILHWSQLQLGRYVMSLALSFFVVHSRVIIVSKLVKRWMLWHLGDPSDMVLSCTNQIDQCFSSDLIAAFSVL